MKKYIIRYFIIVLCLSVFGTILNGCTSLLRTAMALDPSSKQNTQRLINSERTLTVNVRGTVFNLRIDVIRNSGGSTYCYVSTSKPSCVFKLPEGVYNVYLRIGDRTIDKIEVRLYGNKNVYLTSR